MENSIIRTRIEKMNELLESIAEMTNALIVDQFGSDSDWDNHVGREWKGSKEKPSTTTQKEQYLLMTIWNMRHESNDVLNYLSFATEEDLKEFLEPYISCTENNSGVEL